MNRFGSKEMRPLIDGLRRRAQTIYLATDEAVAEDFAGFLIDAADTLEAADGYFMVVEAAAV